MQKKNLHRILVLAPALGIAILLRVFNAINDSAFVILSVFDVVGSIGGVWWLYKSEGIAEKIIKRFRR